MTTSEMSEIAQTVPSGAGSSRVGVARQAGKVARPQPTASSGPRRDLRRAPYPPVVGAAIQRASSVFVSAWDRALRDVRRVQERQCVALLDHAKDTEFGRAHGFASIRTYEEFVRSVPIGDYDAFSPYIDRM